VIQYQPAEEEKQFLTSLLTDGKLFPHPAAQKQFEDVVAADWPALLHALPGLRDPVKMLSWLAAATKDLDSPEMNSLVKLQKLSPEKLARILPRLERRMRIAIEETMEDEADA